MRDWRGREVSSARSEGGVIALADFADNLIRVNAAPWPPPPIVQKLYESRQSRAFKGRALRTVTERLGFYSDLQSVNSEDAITWSYFGPLAASPARLQVEFLDWLMATMAVPCRPSDRCTIDLWRRIPHPDTRVPGGPEVDVVIDGDRAVVFGEAKWRSREGRKQGASRKKGQMELRRDFFSTYGPRLYPGRALVVLAVTREGTIEAQRVPDAEPVFTRDISWSRLTTWTGHPCGSEFTAYLDWKESALDSGALP